MTLTKPIWASIATPAIAGIVHPINNPCTAAVAQCSPVPTGFSTAPSFTPAAPEQVIPMGRLSRAGFHVLDLRMMTDAFRNGVKGLSIEHPDVIVRRYRGTNPPQVE